MSKPWGGVGAWALEAERAEAEELEAAANPAPSAVPATTSNFPSLREAAAARPKKKKGTTLSLSEFTSGTPLGPNTGGSAPQRRLTHEEMLRLPTGPKERSAEELENTRGFRSYGYGRGGVGGGGGGGAGGGGAGGAGGRRGYGGGFEEGGGERRGAGERRGLGEMDMMMPSRADEVGNWGAGKKVGGFGSGMDSGMGRQDRYGSLGSRGSSKADEADSWFSAKKPISAPAPSRYSGFGSGFRDSGGLSDSDRWARGGGGLMSNNGDRDLRERPKLVLEPRKGEAGGSGTTTDSGKTRPSPFGGARPREEVLAGKGLDWRKIDTANEVKKMSRPTSSHSSRSTSSHSSRPGSPGSARAVVEGEKARPKVNPFGDARPRELLLQEKGRDRKKIDLELEHHSVDRSETEEEKLLKEEIDHLKKALSTETEGNLTGDSEQSSDDKATSLLDQISQKETDLKKLSRELDDKVRFGQKVAASSGGRFAFSSDRPPSQSGIFEEAKSMEFLDRPRSRGGNGDAWNKPDDRRGYQGGREARFLGSRNTDRVSRRIRNNHREMAEGEGSRTNGTNFNVEAEFIRVYQMMGAFVEASRNPAPPQGTPGVAAPADPIKMVESFKRMKPPVFEDRPSPRLLMTGYVR